MILQAEWLWLASESLWILLDPRAPWQTKPRIVILFRVPSDTDLHKDFLLLLSYGEAFGTKVSTKGREEALSLLLCIGRDGGNWVIQSMSSQVQKPLSKTIASWFASRFQGLSWGKWVSNNLTTFSLPLALSALKKKDCNNCNTAGYPIFEPPWTFLYSWPACVLLCFLTPTTYMFIKWKSVPLLLYFDFWI